MNPIPYTVTNESLTMILAGQSHVVRRDAVNFMPLRSALLEERWDAVNDHLTIARSIESWATGDFTVSGQTVCLRGEALPGDLNKRLFSTAARGDDPTPLMRFWERLQKNPSWRSVQQLWKFLEHDGIPIDENGFVLAYKAVRHDWTDFHSGTCTNKPGTVNEMPRNRISDDPDVACHFGYHVGALAYAERFGDESRRMIICRVDPADVVCVPYDEGGKKMRVCKYEVVGNYGSRLPSDTMTSTDIGVSNGPEEPEIEDIEEIEDIDDDSGSVEAHEEPVIESVTAEPSTEILDTEDEIALAEYDLSTLRKYAANVLKIVGASKIPGGKRALVARIVEVRRTT